MRKHFEFENENIIGELENWKWYSKKNIHENPILLTISDRYESDMDLNNGNLTK